MIVGPMIHVPTDQIDDSRLDALVVAALDSIEARLGAGEDPDTVVVHVVGTVLGGFGRSVGEVTRVAEQLLRLLAGQREP